MTVNVPTLELDVPLTARVVGGPVPSATGVSMSDPERKSLFGIVCEDDSIVVRSRNGEVYSVYLFYCQEDGIGQSKNFF